MTKAEFNNLTDAQKRILMAQDVLKYLDEQILIASQGEWLKNNTIPFKDESLQLNRCLVGKQCYVCWKGSLFYAHMMRFNNFTVEDYNNDMHMEHNIYNQLPFFSKEQLDMIELAFEGEIFGWMQSHMNFKNKRDCLHFFDKHQDGSVDDILRTIMNNIVRNNGEFVPSQDLGE